VFLESIVEANKHGADKWGTYYIKDRVRLLVGSLIVLTIHKQGVWVTLDQQQLEESQELKHSLELSLDWQWDTDEYSEYSAVPSKNGYYTPSKDLQLWSVVLRELHFAFIRRVANKYGQLRVSSQVKHMPDLLAYLRYELKKYVPAPVYEKDEILRLPEEIADDESLLEGSRRKITINAYERNPKARRECIAHHGTSCAVCRFNFAEVYGEVGKDFIHVHHLKQLADIGSEYEVNPVSDLRPVCPNCHAIIHKGNPPYSIEEVKSFLRSRQSS
jgi:5-methylcytosine-specific restriction protein A